MPEAIGIPEDMLREASKLGICKINVGTDIRVAYVGAFRKALSEHPEKFEARAFIEPAMDAVTALVEDKVQNVMGCAGHAND
jgi:fructose-bisphosphate aldolase class II